MKLFKKVMTILLTFLMILALTPVSVQAATSLENIDSDSLYAIVSKTTGKAVKVRNVSWQEDGYVYVDGKYKDGTVDGKAAFYIIKNDSGTVAFRNYTNKANLKCEGTLDSGIPCVFDLEDGTEGPHGYTLESSKDGYRIICYGKAYLGIDSKKRFAKVSQDDAETFTFEKVEVKDEEANHISLENKETGKYLSYKGVSDESRVKVNVDKESLSNTEKFTYTPTSNGDHEDIKGIEGNTHGFGLVDLDKDGYVLSSANWVDGAGAVNMMNILKKNPGGWESVALTPNGDGTVSIRNMRTWQLATLNEDNELVLTDETKVTDKEKYIVHSNIELENVPTVNVDEKKSTEISISWNNNYDEIISGYEVWRKAPGEDIYTKIKDTNETLYTDTDLNKSSEYSYQVRYVNGQGTVNGDILSGGFSKEVTVKTLKSERPYAPKDLNIENLGDNKLKLTWDGNNSSEVTYKVYQGPSAYCKEEDFKEIANDLTDTEYTINYEEGHKYDYYKVVASNEDESSKLSDVTAISLEKVMFGKNIYFFAPTDEVTSINKVIQDIFKVQNSLKNNAQFNENRYAFYFKKGDYKDIDSIQVGFYTHVAGLGRTPYDVEVNNIETGCYLADYNATCNFWRSAENLAVTGTGEVQVDQGSWTKSKLNWSVAQAAPLRRIYSTRPVQYDYNYGWASGGYTADCLFDVKDGEGNSAGTFSGQQYFTRNTEMPGNAYGTTLNNFLMGVKSANSTLPDTLKGGNGTTNWPMHENDKDKDQRVITSVETTPAVREKPFLFMDEDGEYKVFVPALRKNSQGVSWGEGKANNGMGEGDILSIDDFYIAQEGDSADVINKAINDGKNIFFTPGVYHADTPIFVNKDNTIVLGTGMASIIPDNDQEAMTIGDVDNVIVSGIIFDAGTSSENMLTVGTTHGGQEDKPVFLQDLFFRIGGTTESLTKAKNGIIINRDYVLTDHFWIWRADHGAGVKWGEEGNLSDYGIIVNGDHVTCMALFDEHFEKNDVLWNGEDGATYFLQNEKCYDPISQKDWMSHNGTVKGYSAYKVANNVKKHYAVGLGIYNVFIYTGESYDSSKVSIQLDNAIEVPNSEDVLIENACIQTFAKDDGAFQSFKHIINGVGEGVSSGKTNNKLGEGWSRKYLIYYNNGTALYGAQPSEKQKNKYVEDVLEENIPTLGDEVDHETMTALIEQAEAIDESLYTPESYINVLKALKEASKVNTKKALKNADESVYNDKLTQLQKALNNLKLKNTTVEVPEDKQDIVTSPTLATQEKNIVNITGHGDPKGSTFNLLQAKAKKVTKKNVTLSWTKVKGATNYVVYGNVCGKKNKYVKLATVGNKNTKKITKILNKKLKKGTYYKFIVVATAKYKGQTKALATSKSIHFITKGNKKYGDFKNVKLTSKATISLAKGKTSQIKAKQIKPKKIKVKQHRKLAYESNNTNVATVNNKGKITAKSKGKAVIYVYSQNGLFKKVTVNVK